MKDLLKVVLFAALIGLVLPYLVVYGIYKGLEKAAPFIEIAFYWIWAVLKGIFFVVIVSLMGFLIGLLVIKLLNYFSDWNLERNIKIAIASSVLLSCLLLALFIFFDAIRVFTGLASSFFIGSSVATIMYRDRW